MEQALPEDITGLKSQIEDLTRQVRSLGANVEALSVRVQYLSGRSATPPIDASTESGIETVSLPRLEASKAATLLSTLAAASFLLVIALVLRTAADSGLINQQIGTFIGLAYAFTLFVFEHLRYLRAHRPVPVYSACGAILVFAILLENRVQLEALFYPFAYVILAASLLAMVALGIRHRAPALIFLGTFGVSGIGIALGFPEPIFPLAAGLLLISSIAATLASRIPKCRWLLWVMLGITMFFWLMWTVKLSVALGRGDAQIEPMAPHWFLPYLGIFVGWYLLLSFRSSLRADGHHDAFGSSLPAVTIAGAYPAARAVLAAGFGPISALGAIGIALAVLMAVWAFGLVTHKAPGNRYANSFMLASMLLWCAALPSVVWNLDVAIIIWSGIGLLLAVLSSRWQHGVFRSMSHLIQLYACGTAVLASEFFALQPPSVGRTTLALTLALLCITQYFWCRAKPVAGPSLDPHDRASVIPLLIAITYAFASIRIAWYAISSTFGTDGVFLCGETVLVNSAALALALCGLLKKDGELLVVSVLIAILGTAKVFAFDFFHLQGLALVLSVFSFGLMAALGALIWKHWQPHISTRVESKSQASGEQSTW